MLGWGSLHSLAPSFQAINLCLKLSSHLIPPLEFSSKFFMTIVLKSLPEISSAPLLSAWFYRSNAVQIIGIFQDIQTIVGEAFWLLQA
jgi:hypothetical protein